MDGNDKLEELLNEVMQNTDAQQQLSSSLGLGASAEGSGPKEESNE
jgi:predicted component of type VI protein secretion system